MNRRTLLLVVLILLGSAALGAIRLHVPSFSPDEIAAIQAAPGDVPSLYAFLLHGWVLLAGQSEAAARWPSLLFGLLALALTYRLAARHASRRIGLLALVTLASSAVFVRYFREAAPYTFVVCLGAFSVLCLVNWLRCKRRKDLVIGVLSASVIMLMYLAAARQTATTEPIPLTTTLDGIVRALTNDSLGLFALLAIVGARHVSPLRNGRVELKLFILALLWLIIPLVIALIFRAAPRMVLLGWPAMALITAFGIDAVSPRAARLAIVVVLVGIGIAQVANDLPATLPGAYPERYWREVFSTIAANARDTDGYFPLNIPWSEPLEYYRQRYAPFVELAATQPINDFVFAAELTGVWLVSSDDEPKYGGQLPRMYRDYIACRTWTFPDQTTLAEWQRLTRPFYEFGQQIAMQGTPLNPVPTRYRPGDVLDLAFGFRARQTPALNYSVGVYVLSTTGQVIAQQDGPLAGQQTSTWQPGDAHCDLHRIPVPATPGEYTVRVAIYDSQSQTRLNVSPAVGEADAAPVLTFTVERQER